MKTFKLFVLVVILLIALGNVALSQGNPRLYFCEDYRNGNEINVSDVFTTGYLTVMVDLRPAGMTLGDDKVELILMKIKDEYGDRINFEFVNSIPFDVSPDWDYIYFQENKKLGFNVPGTYAVALFNSDGDFIVSGNIKVISR